MTLPALLAGLATGLLLGLFGSGGSIITTPALLYLLHVEPKSAIAMSLGIVAVTATLTAVQHGSKGNIDWKVTAIFGLFGVVGTYAGARLGLVTPVVVQLCVFALVMYAAAWKMLRPQPPAHRSVGVVAVQAAASDLRLGHVAVHGIAVGVLTGVVGVGGGFLIVPALVLFSGLPMKQAVGTSLAIVALKSFAGFAGYAGEVPIDYPLMGLFTAVAAGGSLFGTRLAHHLSGETLKRAFALFLLPVATYILANSLL